MRDAAQIGSHTRVSPAAPEEEGTKVATTGERTGAQPPGGGRTLFVRNATGLVRELSAFDAVNLVRLYRRHQGMRFAGIPPE